ncbi:putative histidinol-phosphatase [Desulfosarcina alkanivorans]|uniref:Histidinol-phosphatase n=1 Tax=Desulfosarcina alkanivorans TaxID=571177 RepID=A0A5K7YGN5_9BACT|nr:histidinol-phosphatase [Desulfosarcina alkanivorans]BBO67575.1 putative histidinol-phosphatase [Desulfosarcina alkanivorans]
MNTLHPVSLHGGHSGQFCGHAKDTLEEMVQAYIEQKYPWVGITEHMPPVSDAFVYPEEEKAGLDAGYLKERFSDYMAACRHLQSKYAGDIRIYVGFETESYSGSLDFAKALENTFSPDYVVGSVHHVNDIPFDYSQHCYDNAAASCGGLDGLYAAYFDQQHDMIRALRPQVVGHLDIIRLYDPDYRLRLLKPVIWEKIVRNLKLVKDWNLILDFNLRPLSKGADEPYLSAPILKKACEMGIDIVPGDDSHGVADIGAHMDRAIEMLRAAGLNRPWRKPVRNPR